uniref:DNA 3'-5' helicase n=1 Tax=viral metagenome TaxID=1070528 RepID=A0A6C0CR17_9ZZZZ
MIISNEQQAILECVKSDQRCNLFVNAVPGSGKTTLSLCMAEQNPTLKFLLLTYNSKLRQDSVRRAKDTFLNNVDIHTFHSFGYTLYNNTKCKTDDGLYEILEKNTVLFKKNTYDIIIIDECQDMDQLLYAFSRKIYVDASHPSTRLFIIGDAKQCIYEYKGSDHRYLTLSDRIYPWNTLEWKQYELSYTFRFNKATCDFINECCAQQTPKILNSYNTIDLTKPKYIVLNMFSEMHLIAKEIIDLLAHDVPAEQIMILAASVKTNNSKSPLVLLANYLSMRGVSIYVSSDEETATSDITQNKILISNFHRTKGIERDYIFILGFDHAYFTYYNTSADPCFMPNCIYVALTRCKKRMFLYHHKKNEFVPFLNQDKLKTFTDFITENDGSFKPSPCRYNNDTVRTFSVTALIDKIAPQVLKQCLTYMTVTRLKNKHMVPVLSVPTKTSLSLHGSVENVSVINSEVVNVLFMNSLNQTEPTCFYKSLLRNITLNREHHHPFFKLHEFPSIDLNDIVSVTHYAAYYTSYKENLIYKLKQLTHFTWLHHTNISACVDNIQRALLQTNASSRYQIEKYVEQDIEINAIHYKLKGYIDYYDTDHEVIYEWKCVTNLDKKYFVQCVLYKYLAFASRTEIEEIEEIRKCYLFNSKSGVFYEILVKIEDVFNIIQLLLEPYSKPILNDDEFVHQCIV